MTVAQIEPEQDKVVKQGGEPTTSPHEEDEIAAVRRTLEGVLGVPATEGNSVEVLRNGDQIFPAMLEAIENARHTIDLLTFVYWKGEIGEEFAERLAAKASEGVRVRVLLDSWGCNPMDPHAIELMEKAGVRVRWFRPMKKLRPSTLNHRTHRKVMIVDEEIGFTGGVGIADEWRGDARNEREWRDTHFRVRGPAVDGLRSAFLDNWTETDPTLFEEEYDRFPSQPQPGTAVVQCIRGSSEPGVSDVGTLFRTLMRVATRCVRITTAYFVPEGPLFDDLSAAAQRGVHIQVLLPGPHADKRFVQLAGEGGYESLLECGVELWNFQPSMLHAKTMIVDDLLANVGSANLNSRSVNLDEEVNLVVVDRDLVACLDQQFNEDLERSVRIERGRWEQRSMHQRIAEKLVLPIRRVF